MSAPFDLKLGVGYRVPLGANDKVSTTGLDIRLGVDLGQFTKLEYESSAAMWRARSPARSGGCASRSGSAFVTTSRRDPPRAAPDQESPRLENGFTSRGDSRSSPGSAQRPSALLSIDLGRREGAARQARARRARRCPWPSRGSPAASRPRREHLQHRRERGGRLRHEQLLRFRPSHVDNAAYAHPFDRQLHAGRRLAGRARLRRTPDTRAERSASCWSGTTR